jgi:hypothetical protein
VPHLLDVLNSGTPVVGAELRPPRAELEAAAGMDAWIDTYHAVRSLTSRGTFVFLTDSAVGAPEEDNLRHLVVNLGVDAPRERVVPFLTAKHPLAYCLAHADRAIQHGFPVLVVLGGDRHLGHPRSVEHAWQLREAIRARGSGLLLGGWANPYADAAHQVAYLRDSRFTGEFFLTQVVSHHATAPVERFLREASAAGLALPGIFGVFYYRSASPRTLALLGDFIPVPAEGLGREFNAGVPATVICARTIRAMRALGATHFYISNLPIDRAAETLAAILERVEGE